jgi:hypothetical protein
VIQYDSLRLITALAALYNLDLVQANIKSAFLYHKLKDEIWMLPPSGIGLQDKILRLNKALYGLKRVPNKWYEKISSVFSEYQMACCVVRESAIYLASIVEIETGCCFFGHLQNCTVTKEECVS